MENINDEIREQVLKFLYTKNKEAGKKNDTQVNVYKIKKGLECKTFKESSVLEATTSLAIDGLVEKTTKYVRTAKGVTLKKSGYKISDKGVDQVEGK